MPERNQATERMTRTDDTKEEFKGPNQNFPRLNVHAKFAVLVMVRPRGKLIRPYASVGYGTYFAKARLSPYLYCEDIHVHQ
jgi:hypothetical protein